MRLQGLDFKDTNGNVYNHKTMQNKIVVIKCWYLACQACREEIPALNEMVSHYQKRTDIVFISLVFDSKEEINKFLKSNIFKYASIVNQKNYLMNILKIRSFPTHIIVDRSGFISKVVNSSEELSTALNNEVLN